MEIDTGIGSKFKSWICLRVFDWLFLELIVSMHPCLSHRSNRWRFRDIRDPHSIDPLWYRWPSTGVDLSLSSIHVYCVSSKYSGSPVNRRPFPWAVDPHPPLRCPRLCSIKLLRLFNDHPRGTGRSPLDSLPHAQYLFIDNPYPSLSLDLSILEFPSLLIQLNGVFKDSGPLGLLLLVHLHSLLLDWIEVLVQLLNVQLLLSRLTC